MLVWCQRLSEKGSEQRSEGGFGRYEENETGPKRAFTAVPRIAPRVLPRLFGQSLLLDFSHLRAKGIDMLATPLRQKR